MLDAARIDAETLPVPIDVVVQPPVTIPTVVPPAGITIGGKKVTIRATKFQNGVTITFGGSLATMHRSRAMRHAARRFPKLFVIDSRRATSCRGKMASWMTI